MAIEVVAREEVAAKPRRPRLVQTSEVSAAVSTPIPAQPLSAAVVEAPVTFERAEPQPAPRPSSDALLASFRAIAFVLASRFLVLLGLVGGFMLALIAANAASLVPLYVLIAYAVLVMIPLVALDHSRGPKAN